MNYVKNAILYSRYSSAKQSRGDSVRRQSDKGKAYAEKLGLGIIEVSDKGISAYKAKNNANKGKLADLINQAEKGVIPQGTVLIVESLDRVSRQTPLDALDIFRRLLSAGLEIHTLIDGQKYTKESVDANFFQLLGSLFVLHRAHDESKIKSERIKASVSARKKAVLEEGKLWRGSMPSWVDVVDGRIVLNDFHKVIQRIFKMYISGKGMGEICKDLNAEGVGAARGGLWQHKVIQKLLSNDAVTGVYRVGEQTIDGYYPRVVSKADFARVAALRAGKKDKPGRKQTVHHENVFSGLLKCGKCGTSMYFSLIGKKSKDGKPYFGYRCGSKRNKTCDNPQINFKTFRDLFFESIKCLDWNDLNVTNEDSALNDLLDKKEILAGEIAITEEKESNYLTAIETGRQIELFAKKLDELEIERSDLKKKLSEIEQSIFRQKSNSELKPLVVEKYKDLSEREYQRLHLLLKNQIKMISIKSHRVEGRSYLRTIQVEWANGKKTKVSIFDWIKGSYNLKIKKMLTFKGVDVGVVRSEYEGVFIYEKDLAYARANLLPYDWKNDPTVSVEMGKHLEWIDVI